MEGGKKPPDLFILNTVFPDPASVFSFRLKKLEEIQADCLVVFDTNALLVPYTVDRSSLVAIREAIEPLVEQGRLVIPGQVAREFAKHRAGKIVEVVEKLNGKMAQVGKWQIEGSPIPLLESHPGYSRAVEIERNLRALHDEYTDALKEVVNDIKGWTWDDPVSCMYGELFKSDVIQDPPLTEGERKSIEQDWQRRKENKIPPGFEDESAGDLIIWRTILHVAEQAKKSVIFVSQETKADWRYHRRADGKVANLLYPRYELVDELRRATGGESFHIVPLSEFLSVFAAAPDAVDDVRRSESEEEAMPYGPDLNYPVVTPVNQDAAAVAAAAEYAKALEWEKARWEKERREPRPQADDPVERWVPVLRQDKLLTAELRAIYALAGGKVGVTLSMQGISKALGVSHMSRVSELRIAGLVSTGMMGSLLTTVPAGLEALRRLEE